MLLGKVLKKINQKYKSIKFKNIKFNSKDCKSNDIFFAISGNNINGNKYINDAIKNGAKIIVSNLKFEGFNSYKILFIRSKDPRKLLSEAASNFYHKKPKNIIAVTGTNGKTSIANFYYQLLTLNKKKVATIGTLGVLSKKFSQKTNNTSIDPLNIHKILQKIYKLKIENVILEASSHGIKQHRLNNINFNTAIFTNLSRDHLDYHKTFKNYIDTKKMLFDNLNEKSYSIVNSDDKRSNYIIQNTRSKVYTYGLNTISDYKGKIIENNINGLLLDINNKKVNLKIIGDYNASNILAVYSVGKILKLDDNLILRQISSLKTPKGRFDYVEGGNNTVGIVDYAHTPDALKNILSSINNFKNNKKIITVFGAGGDRDKSKRHQMGKIADEFSDFIYLTSDNPRNEDEMEIINDIMDGVNSKNYSIILNRKDAISKACSDFNSDSIILIAGKGHEQFQIIKDKILPHDDMDILKNELNL